MKIRSFYNSRLIIRSAAVTFFMLTCAFFAFYFMGHAFSKMEMTTFERQTEAFYIVDWDKFSIFGKEYYIPVMTIFDKIYKLFNSYCSGIIKLLGIAYSSVEELIKSMFF